MESRCLHLVLCVLTAVILSGAFLAAAESGEDVQQLIETLSNSKVNQVVRPVKNTSNPVAISVGLGLAALISLDEANGILHSNLRARYVWKDEYLTWDPTEHNGITNLRIPPSAVRLWKPDLAIMNEYEPAEAQSNHVKIFNNGNIFYNPRIWAKTHCDLDLTYYPFDIQTCPILIGSWEHDEDLVDVKLYDGEENIDLADYIGNAQWKLLGTSASRKLVYYDGSPQERYPYLMFRLTIERKSSYYSYIYLAPAVILSLLVPFIFLLPPGDQQKVTLGMGILICFTLFFMEMNAHLSTMHTSIPLIDKYYMATYVLVALSVALSTLVANLAHRATSCRAPPEFLDKVMLGCLGRCLCMQHVDSSGKPTEEQPTDVKTDDGSGNVQQQTSRGSKSTQWQKIAVVLDRLLFLVFLVLSVLMALCILTARPSA